MTNPQRRHDISDAAWALLEPHLPGQSGQWGGVAKDNRLFINAVFWILRTGAPWRDLPPEYGKWGTSGYCVLARRGEICRRNMANGEPFTNVLIVGETSEYGKSSLKY